MSECRTDEDSCLTDEDCCASLTLTPILLASSGSTLVEVSLTPETIATSSSTAIVNHTLVPPTTRASTDADAFSTSTSSAESWLTVSTIIVSSITTSQYTIGGPQGSDSNGTMPSQILSSSETTWQGAATMAIPPNLAEANDDTHTLSKGALAGIVLGTSTIAIVLTVVVLFLLRARRRIVERKKAISPESYSGSLGQPSTKKEHWSSDSSSWPQFLGRASGNTARALDWSLITPCQETRSLEMTRRSAVPGQWLPAVHELPAYVEPRCEDSLRSWIGHIMAGDVSGHTTDIESDEAEEAQVGKARIVRIGKSKLAPI